MDISEKVAYLKGLAEGLEISDSSDEGRILLSILDVLSEMADAIDSLEFDVDVLTEEIDEIDEDLDFVFEDNYSDHEFASPSVCRDYLPDYFYDDDYEGEFYEVTCPNCGQKIILDEEMLDEGEVSCSNCHDILELDFDNIFDGEEDYVEDEDI